jgi:hypothetical protein
MKCKDCKFYWKIDLKHGDCSCEKLIKSYDISFQDSEITTDCMITEYDEGWGFRVGRDFGCIHFKDKQYE